MDNSFLSIIQMAEASDLLLLVQIITADLHPPHQIHIPIVLDDLGFVGGDCQGDHGGVQKVEVRLSDLELYRGEGG